MPILEGRGSTGNSGSGSRSQAELYANLSDAINDAIQKLQHVYIGMDSGVEDTIISNYRSDDPKSKLRVLKSSIKKAESNDNKIIRSLEGLRDKCEALGKKA